jgi:molybdenum cofactor guanylyltransferase
LSSGGANKTTLDISCIILAGGKSKRLGRNKVIETVGNQSLLERVISCLSFLKSEIIIVKAKESILPDLANYTYAKLKLVEDIYPGEGSLGGVYTGLVNSMTFNNIIVACDMPFINQGLLKYMVDIIENYDVVIPRINGILEPLHAIYSQKCVTTIEILIRENRLSISGLIPIVKARYVDNAEIDDFDPHHLSFFNINTQADLDAGKVLVGEKDNKVDKR